jgi:hypothetical protein
VDVPIIRVGKYYINFNNVAYVHIPAEIDREGICLDVVFTSGEPKVRLKDEEAVSFMNLLEYYNQSVFTCS